MFKARKSLMRRKICKSIGLGLLATAMSSTFALADWRKDMGVFRVGISAIDGEPLRAGTFDLFRKMLADTLKMPVEIFQANNASALIDAMASSRIEYAILPATGYATLDVFCSCVVPIAAPVSENGADSVRSVLIVNQNHVTGLSDFKERRIAVGPRSSMTGYMLPYAFLLGGEVSIDKSAFNIVETASQSEAAELFQIGEVDGFFAWENATLNASKSYENEFLKSATESTSLRPAILWRSEPVRFGPHVVRNNLPKEAFEALQAGLLSMEQQEPLAFDSISPELAGGMQAVSQDDYKIAITMVQALAAQ